MATYPVVHKETGEQKEVKLSVHEWTKWCEDNSDWKRDWSDPSTWSGGTKPTAGQNITIAHDVTVDESTADLGNVTINNAASNSCEVIVDFGGNYNFPPLAITAYGYSQSTSEYLIKGQSASVNNTTLKLAGSGSPHGTLGSANLTLSLTRSETGSSSSFGQSTHAWIYFTMGS